MATEAKRVLALPAQVEIGGSTQRLIFDYEALELIEDEFGSLSAAEDAVIRGYGSRLLKLVRVAFTGGLRHARMPPNVVLEMLQPPIHEEQLRAYREAIREAWNTAFPQANESGKGGGEASDSPGESTTTSRRSDSAVQTRSSDE
jgi:hypothetical protein